jgi:hypothetical protein
MQLGGAKPLTRNLRRCAIQMGIANTRGDIVIQLKATRATAMVAVLAIALQSSPVQADDGAGEAGAGAAAAISSLVYGPVKIVYSILGVVFGGFAWGLSGGDTEVLSAVVSPAIRGDYVITPSHIRGERQIEFIGRQPEYREDTVVLEEFY